jgi:hypothetical protein
MWKCCQTRICNNFRCGSHLHRRRQGISAPWARQWIFKFVQSFPTHVGHLWLFSEKMYDYFVA